MEVHAHTHTSVRPGSCPAASTTYMNEDGRPREFNYNNWCYSISPPVADPRQRVMDIAN
jgi:hypothetical protein